MKYPDVFGSLYIMSPCCMSARMAGGGRPGARPAGVASAGATPPGSTGSSGATPTSSGPSPLEQAVAAAKTSDDVAKLPFGLQTQLASAAAWSPNPKKPPLYADLPTKDGVPQPEEQAKWAANAPLAFVDQYIGNLRQYHGIAMDVGDQDGLRFDAGKLHDILDSYGLANSFEIYHGTHTSAVADRFQNHVMKFFDQNLKF